MKLRKDTAEFRYYAVPEDMKMLALLGDEWVQCFGDGVDNYHFHNHMEIGYCYYGTGSMVFKDNQIPFRAGTCTVIPKNVPHITKSEPGTISRWEYLFVDVENIVSAIFSQKKLMADHVVQSINSKVHVWSDGEHKELTNAIWRILKEMNECSLFYKERSYGILQDLMTGIARLGWDPEEERQTDEGGIGQITPALNYISHYFNEPLKIGDLANACFLSESHFRRIFGNCMNMTPLEYITLIRIKVACELLDKTNDSIRDIACRVGFSTPSSFNRNFKRIMGVSPLQWRNLPERYESKIINWEVLEKNRNNT